MTTVRTLDERDAEVVATHEKLRFYEIMSEKPVTARELAKRTGVQTRFVRDWLRNQARQGYLTYEAATERYASWCRLPRAA